MHDGEQLPVLASWQSTEHELVPWQSISSALPRPTALQVPPSGQSTVSVPPVASAEQRLASLHATVVAPPIVLLIEHRSVEQVAVQPPVQLIAQISRPAVLQKGVQFPEVQRQFVAVSHFALPPVDAVLPFAVVAVVAASPPSPPSSSSSRSQSRMHAGASAAQTVTATTLRIHAAGCCIDAAPLNANREEQEGLGDMSEGVCKKRPILASGYTAFGRRYSTITGLVNANG
jgi:hypothetical protein